MLLRQPLSTRTDPLFPYPTLFRSDIVVDTPGQRMGVLTNRRLLRFRDGIPEEPLLAILARYPNQRLDEAADGIDMPDVAAAARFGEDRKSKRLNSSH